MAKATKKKSVDPAAPKKPGSKKTGKSKAKVETLEDTWPHYEAGLNPEDGEQAWLNHR